MLRDKIKADFKEAFKAREEVRVVRFEDGPV